MVDSVLECAAETHFLNILVDSDAAFLLSLIKEQLGILVFGFLCFNIAWLTVVSCHVKQA